MRKFVEMDVDFMRRHFEYKPHTGELIRKRIDLVAGDCPRRVAMWNGRFAGRTAGAIRTCSGGHKYMAVRVDGRVWAGHRICWAIMTGQQPPPSIDHYNGDGTDNRWENLKDGHDGLNERNQALQKNNTSGVCGVTWNKAINKWQARITVRRQHIDLGRFESLDDARMARLNAERKFGFSERHGKDKREAA